MEKKIIFSLSLLVFAGLVVSVYALAQPQTLELKIYKGWNLVSLAVMGGTTVDFDITCSPRDLIVLYGYDPLEKQYVKIKDVTEAEVFGSAGEFYKETGNYIARSSVNSGWLYSTADCTITLRGPVQAEFSLDAISSSYQTTNITFPAGWNFFTVFPDMVGKSLDEIKGDCIIEKSYTWNPEAQTWWKLKNQPFPETVVGNGIVFKTTNDCLLGGKKVTVPEAPALPE